jgi:hypothetical protein
MLQIAKVLLQHFCTLRLANVDREGLTIRNHLPTVLRTV